ncbi:MAG: hypothetical protein ACP5Q5_00865 [Brevinematia bacterium]
MRIAEGCFLINKDERYFILSLITGELEEIDLSKWKSLKEIQDKNESFMPDNRYPFSEKEISDWLKKWYITCYSEEEEKREILTFLESKVNKLKTSYKEVFLLVGKPGYLKRERKNVSWNESKLKNWVEKIKKEENIEKVNFWSDFENLELTLEIAKKVNSYGFQKGALWLSVNENEIENFNPFGMEDLFSNIRLVILSDKPENIGDFLDFKDGCWGKGDLFFENFENVLKDKVFLICPFIYRKVCYDDIGKKDYCPERLLSYEPVKKKCNNLKECKFSLFCYGLKCLSLNSSKKNECLLRKKYLKVIKKEERGEIYKKGGIP